MSSQKLSVDPTKTKAPFGPGLRVIAGFKLAQGLLLAMVGTGILFLISKDADAVVAHWLTAWHIDTDNNFVHNLLNELDTISPIKFERLSAGAFLYSLLLMIEGIGLLLEKHWAEYLTVVVTGSFLPWELYEVTRHFNFGALALLAANGGVVWYLINGLRAKQPK